MASQATRKKKSYCIKTYYKEIIRFDSISCRMRIAIQLNFPLYDEILSSICSYSVPLAMNFIRMTGVTDDSNEIDRNRTNICCASGII